MIAGEPLHEYAAGAPLRWAVAIDYFADGKADAGVGLFAGSKVVFGALGQRRAVKRDHALERRRVVAEVEREHEAACAQQFARRHSMQARELFGGALRQPRISAQATVDVLSHQKRHRSFALRLDDEAAVCL